MKIYEERLGGVRLDEAMTEKTLTRTECVIGIYTLLDRCGDMWKENGKL